MNRVCAVIVLVVLCQGVSNATECTTRGRFPNDVDGNCRGYTMCLSGAEGVYIQYDLTCPQSFIYSHIDNYCTNATTYQCLPTHKCASVGNFEDTSSTDCTSYISCINALNSTSARRITCPVDMLFNPVQGACVNATDFDCIGKTPNVQEVLSETNVNKNSANNVVSVSSYLLFVVISCMKLN